MSLFEDRFRHLEERIQSLENDKISLNNEKQNLIGEKATLTQKIQDLSQNLADQKAIVKKFESRRKSGDGHSIIHLPPYRKLYDLLWGNYQEFKAAGEVLVGFEKVKVPVFDILECYRKPESGLDDDALERQFLEDDKEDGEGNSDDDEGGEDKILAEGPLGAKEILQESGGHKEEAAGLTSTATEPKPEILAGANDESHAKTTAEMEIEEEEREAEVLERRQTFTHEPQTFDYVQYSKVQPSTYKYAKFDFINIYGKAIAGQNLIQKIMPCQSGRLLIRENYIELEKYMVDVITRALENELDKTAEPARKKLRTFTQALGGIKTRYFVVTGQPGVGKSCFQYYILIMRALKGQPTIIKAEDTHFYFSSQGFRQIGNLGEDLTDDDYANNESWYLSDGPPDKFLREGRLTNWIVVITTSPKPEVWEKLLKQNSNAGTLLYMKPWSWVEVFGAGVYVEALSGDEAYMTWRNFTLYGSVARILLNTLEPGNPEYDENEDILRDKIDRKIHRMLQSQMEAYTSEIWSDEASHTVILTEPAKGRLTRCRRRVITPYVGLRFAKAELLHRAVGRQSLISRLSNIPQASQLSGFVFEGAVHNLAKQYSKTSEKLLSVNMKTKETVEIIFRGVASFDSWAQLERMVRLKEKPTTCDPDILNVYLRPTVPNSESVDSLMVTRKHVLLFQITCAKAHHVSAHGLQKINEKLPSEARKLPWKLIFITPTLKSGEAFGEQRISGPDKELNKTWTAKLEQELIQIPDQSLRPNI